MYITSYEHLRRWTPYWAKGMNKGGIGRGHTYYLVMCGGGGGGGGETGRGGEKEKEREVWREPKSHYKLRGGLVVSFAFQSANISATTVYKQGHNSQKCCDCVSSLEFLY